MSEQPFLPQLFFQRAKSLSRERAFHYCRVKDRKWVDMTWRRYRDEVCKLASWLQAQGVQKGDRVALLSANRPEWIIADLAVMSIGGVTVPVYATASEKDIRYILDHSGAKLMVTDHTERVATIKDIKLDAMLLMDPADEAVRKEFQAELYDWSQMQASEHEPIKEPVDLKADDMATIIYTSGTTGRPKGVVHEHANFRASFKTIIDILHRTDGEVDRFFSFLPLSHVAERMLVMVGSIVSGSEVSFARTIDTMPDDLLRCRPTILLCVPRLWEKIYEKINAGLLTASPVKKAVFKLARTLGERRLDGDQIISENDASLAAKISDTLVGHKLKTKLGLDRCRMLVTGSAPTRPEVMKFFGVFGMRIREVYGLTENLCLGVLNDADKSVIGSCGRAFDGNTVKIADDQEILFKADWNFQGYYKNPEATAEVMKDGWLHTGDLGSLDAEGRLRIVGRKKELLKTSGGKYVAPVPIEDSLKIEPCVEEAMIVGDERKYCVAIVSLNEEVMQSQDGDVKAVLKDHLSKINEPLASYESIKRIGVLKEGFSVEKGSLTPTLKVKRKVVTQQYEEFIEKLYHSDEPVVFEG